MRCDEPENFTAGAAPRRASASGAHITNALSFGTKGNISYIDLGQAFACSAVPSVSTMRAISCGVEK